MFNKTRKMKPTGTPGSPRTEAAKTVESMGKYLAKKDLMDPREVAAKAAKQAALKGDIATRKKAAKASSELQAQDAESRKENQRRRAAAVKIQSIERGRAAVRYIKVFKLKSKATKVLQRGILRWIRRVQQKDLIKAAKAEVEARRARKKANLAARRDRKKQEKEEAAEGRRRPSTEKVKSPKDTTPKGDEKKAKEAEADKNKKPKDAEAAVKAKLKGTKEERERLEAQMLRAQRMREEQEKQRRDKIKGAEISEEQRQIQQAIDEACGAVRPWRTACSR